MTDLLTQDSAQNKKRSNVETEIKKCRHNQIKGNKPMNSCLLMSSKFLGKARQ